MAELTPQERLQPSLLDRLCDDERTEFQESRSKRVLSLQRLRQSVLRDLAWLLNTVNYGHRDELEESHPHVARSVLNFGIPDMTGQTGSGVDAREMEKFVRDAILRFEPRILPDTLRVRATSREALMNHNALVFEIEGELWAQPVPLEMILRTQLDLETGEVTVIDAER